MKMIRDNAALTALNTNYSNNNLHPYSYHTEYSLLDVLSTLHSFRKPFRFLVLAQRHSISIGKMTVGRFF